MNQIKVLELIDEPFLGGGQINLLSLASSLDRSLFQVSVCSAEDGPLVEELKGRSIPHFSVPITKRFSRKIFTGIARILNEYNFSVLHTHGGVAGFYGRWAARRSRVPVIVHTLHGIHYLHYRNVFLKRAYILLEKIFSRFSDAVIFVCDSDRNSARKYGLVPEDKGVVINNGLDWSVFDRLEGKPLEKQNWEKELGIGLSSPVVGTVARLHRQKGLTYLLQAARLLSERIPGIKILVVGGGPLKSKLEEQKRRLKLEGTVYFLGERRDASRLLSLFDVFVLPSLWEGLPYSLMEAGALGKPVVAAAVDGVKEMIIDGRTGVLVPPKHAEKLALAVCRLLEDRAWARKMGSALQVGLRDKYSLFRMVKETQSLYLRLYHKKTSRS